MTQTLSKARQQAEIAFTHEQSQFFARGRAVEELDATNLAREAKTARLREARLAKQAQDIHSASAGLIAKRAAKA